MTLVACDILITLITPYLHTFVDIEVYTFHIPSLPSLQIEVGHGLM
jgi:hypothetical protein